MPTPDQPVYRSFIPEREYQTIRSRIIRAVLIGADSFMALTLVNMWEHMRPDIIDAGFPIGLTRIAAAAGVFTSIALIVAAGQHYVVHGKILSQHRPSIDSDIIDTIRVDDDNNQ